MAARRLGGAAAPGPLAVIATPRSPGTTARRLSGLVATMLAGMPAASLFSGEGAR